MNVYIISSLNQISLLKCTCSCDVEEIEKKRKEAMAKREDMGKRRIHSEEEKGSGRLPFQVTPGDSSFLIICISANMCISVGW